jgi:hypothetical protein
MKMLLLCALFALSAVELSGSTKDIILGMYSFDEPSSATTEKTATQETTSTQGPEIILVTDLSSMTKDQERRMKALERLFAPKRVSSSNIDALDHFTLITGVKEDSMTYVAAERIASTYDLWKELKGGYDTTLLGQPVTVYLQSKLVWNIGDGQQIKLRWSGKGIKEVSWTIPF